MSKRSVAQTLIDQFWGSDWINSIPSKWKAGLKYLIRKTPGVPIDSDPDAVVAPIVASQIVTDRTNESEKQTTELDPELNTGSTQGQEIFKKYGFGLPFTEHLAATGDEIGDTNKEIDPLNPSLAEVKEYTDPDFSGAPTLEGQDILLPKYGVGQKFTEHVAAPGAEIGDTDKIITPVDPNFSEVKELIAPDFTGAPVLEGQELDERTGVPIPFTETLTAPGVGLGDEDTQITPVNKFASETKVYDRDALEAFLLAWELEYPGKVNIDLPTKLVSLEGVIEKVLGQGASDQTGSVAVFGDYSVNMDLHASAQASAAISGDVSPGTESFWGSKRSCVHKHFILRSPVTQADVLARIGAVSDWPSFTPKSVQLKVVSQRMSIQVTADSKGSDSVHAITDGMNGSSSSSGGGTGYSEEVGHSLKIIRIPETIHAALGVGGDTDDTQAISATASAEATSLGPAETITRTPDDDPFARITPTTIAASAGDTNWPTGGTFLYDVIADPFKLKFIQFHCILVTLP